MRAPARSDRRVALLLALGLFAAYLIFYSGRLKNSADEWFMYTLADSIARNASLDVDQMAYVGEFKGLAKIGPDGHLYSKYSPVQSLLAVPLLWAGRWLPWVGQAQLALLVNPALTAATAALIYLGARRLGHGCGSSLGAALCYGLATTAFVDAKTFTSEVSTAFGLMLAAYAAIRFHKLNDWDRTCRWDRTLRRRWVFLSGAALGLIVMSKQANVAAVPGFLLAYWLARRWDVRTWIAFGVPLAVAGALILAYNLARFGDPLQTGYGPADGTFSADWARSLPGLLISPGRGLLIFSPVLLLSVAAMPAFARRHSWATLLIVGASLPFALLYAKWHGWHGGLAAWGPRYWIPLIPFASLPLAAAFDRLGPPRPRPAWIAAGAVIAISIVIQLSAVSFNYLAYVAEFGAARQIDLLTEDDELGRLAFEPAASPILNQWRFVQPRFSDVAWLEGGPAGRSGPSGIERVDGVALGAGLAALAVALAAIRPRRDPRFAPAGLALAAGVIAAAALTVAARETAAVGVRDGWTEAVRRVDAAAAPGAVLLTRGVDPLAATFTWLKGPIDHYGIGGSPGDPLGADENRWIAIAINRPGEVWAVWPAGQGGALEARLAAEGRDRSGKALGPLEVVRFGPPRG